MPGISEESEYWIEQAKRKRKPYGQRRWGRGVWIVTVVERKAREIRSLIRRRGLVRWRAVNAQRKPYPVVVEVSLQEKRVKWRTKAKGQKRGEDSITVSFTVPAWDPDDPDSCYAENETTREFEVLNPAESGSETVVTRCSRRSTYEVISVFDIGSDSMGLLDMAFESAKAIPVFGQVVVAPFQKEYEKRQQAEHEERVKTELGRSGALTAETLAAALEMSADVSAIREGLEVLAQQLNELAADEAVADEAPKISTFPLPYAPEYLIQELNVLLPADGDSSVFDKALSESGWEGDDRTMRIHDRVTAFVRSATGQVKKFTAVLEQLFRARPDSDPLARAVEYLRRGED